MKIMERLVQQVRPDKWTELEAIDKQYDAVESRLGFPPKKRYRCLAAPHNIDTLVIERVWDSMAALEAAYEKSFTDPELQALNAQSLPIIKSNQFELYWVLS